MKDDFDILEEFRSRFPNLDKKMMNYGRGSKTELRVTIDGGEILIFIYKDADHWQLMTIKEYVKILELLGRGNLK